jgi:cation diffusion facilitator CzcD-associated flavoprotein CzcO
MKSHIPEIPGIELAETYENHSTNKDDYKFKRVLIIGKGNSAFETATFILDTA